VSTCSCHDELQQEVGTLRTEVRALQAVLDEIADRFGLTAADPEPRLADVITFPGCAS